MALLGIGFTVSIVVTMMGLVHGLEATFIATGYENDLVIIRQGALNEVNSYFARNLFSTIKFLPGITRSSEDEPLAVGEIVVVVDQTRMDGQSSNVIVRGTSDVGFFLRPEVRIIEGRRFRSGLREINVSLPISRRFRNMRIGEKIHIAKSDWTVVGIFEAGGTAYESEVWADYAEISNDWDRHSYSSLLVRAEDPVSTRDLRRRIAEDPRINLQAIPQRKYFAEQTTSSLGIKALGIFIAIIMGIGASFAAMNMMYGAVMSRSNEIATLRALGFRRRSILASFLVESILLGLAGGILGCLFSLPINGLSTSTGSFQTYSEVLFNFRLTPAILLWGLGFAALVGALGGYFPARRAANVKLIDLLRD
jgi:putative ABC transport system permease protein